MVQMRGLTLEATGPQQLRRSRILPLRVRVGRHVMQQGHGSPHSGSKGMSSLSETTNSRTPAYAASGQTCPR